MRVAALALAAAVCWLAAAAPAQAALSAGSVLDPRDTAPNRNGSQADVAGVRVTYDDASGTVRIVLAMHDPWTGSVEDPSTLAGPEGFLTIALGRRGAFDCSAGARSGDLSVEAIFSADQAAGTATLVGASRELEAREEQVTRRPREVTYVIADPALAGRDFDCVDGIAAEAALDGARDTVTGFALTGVELAATPAAPLQAASVVAVEAPALGTAPATATAAPLASRVSIRASHSVRSLLGGGLRVPLTCTSACRASATLDIDRRLARRLGVPARLARGSAALPGGRLALSLRVRDGSARLRRELPRVRARIRVAVTAASGGDPSITARRVRLVR